MPEGLPRLRGETSATAMARGLLHALPLTVVLGAATPGQTVGFPFQDDFETGTLGAWWQVATTAAGQVLVTSSHAPNGGYHCTMDAATSLTDSVASMTLTVDLANQKNVLVEFFWKEFGDESDPEDGVFVSDDGGATWQLALALHNGSTSYASRAIDLDGVIAAHGLTYNDHFQIRFQWNDDYPISTDGFAFDDISVRPLDYTVFHSLTGVVANDDYGRAVTRVGDVDGDGLADFAVGVPAGDVYSPNDDLGLVEVRSGVSGVLLQRLIGLQSDGLFGFALDEVGDLNGDGIAEIVVGAYRTDLPATDGGAALVYDVASGFLLWGASGAASSDYLGWSVAGVGDVDGDGVNDLAVGVPRANAPASDCGKALVISGANQWTLHEWVGSSGGDQAGYAVAAVGDYDADGFPDVLYSAPYADDSAGNGGLATVRSGRTSAELASWSGLGSSDNLGLAVAGVEDLDGDGFPDLVLGAPYDDDAGSSSGTVFARKGRTGALLWTATGQIASDNLGFALAPAGDANLDGVPDVLVGAPSSSSVEPGYARLVSGVDGSELREFSGDAGNERYGSSVDGLGDTNGDGVGDMIVGAPWESSTASKAGAVRVLSSLAAPILSGADGALSFEAGEVVLHGDNFLNLSGVSLDGVPHIPSAVANDEIRVPVGLGAPGFVDIEVQTPLGTATLHEALARFPAVESGAVKIGGTATITLHNGGEGAFLVAAGVQVFPVPAQLPGIHHGLELAAPVLLGSGTASAHDPSPTLSLPVPAQTAWVGVPLHFQGFALQGVIPLNTSSFTNVWSVVIQSGH